MFEKTDRPTFKNQRSDYLTELDKINSLFINSDLRGRKKIVSSVQEITQQNIKEVLQAALPVHDKNKAEIQQLHDIFTGKQKIENRSKKYATAVNNKIVENHRICVIGLLKFHKLTSLRFLLFCALCFEINVISSAIRVHRLCQICAKTSNRWLFVAVLTANNGRIVFYKCFLCLLFCRFPLAFNNF